MRFAFARISPMKFSAECRRVYCPTAHTTPIETPNIVLRNDRNPVKADTYITTL
jgi:hypothetical protein